MWFTLALFNFLNAVDTSFNLRAVRRLRDLVFGAVLGLIFSQLYFYAFGILQVDNQYESLFVHCVAFILRGMGVVCFLFIMSGTILFG